MEHLRGKNYVPWHLEDPTEIRQLTLWTSLWVSYMCKEFMTYRHLRKAFHTKDQDRQTWKGTLAAAEAGRERKERWPPQSAEKSEMLPPGRRDNGQQERETGEMGQPTQQSQRETDRSSKNKDTKKKETIKETIPKVERKKSQNMNFHIIRTNRVPDTVSFHYRLLRC